MPLKVVGAGVGRTGTNSLKVALEKLLGGQCHHMFEVLANPSQIPGWTTAIENGGDTDWHGLDMELDRGRVSAGLARIRGWNRGGGSGAPDGVADYLSGAALPPFPRRRRSNLVSVEPPPDRSGTSDVRE